MPTTYAATISFPFQPANCHSHIYNGLPTDMHFCRLSVCMVLYAPTVTHPIKSPIAVLPVHPLALLQVLCCEIDGIFDTLVTNEELLSYFFSILEQQRPLVSTRAGYFARVLSSLLTKCSSPVMQFVQGENQTPLYLLYCSQAHTSASLSISVTVSLTADWQCNRMATMHDNSLKPLSMLRTTMLLTCGAVPGLP